MAAFPGAQESGKYGMGIGRATRFASREVPLSAPSMTPRDCAKP